MDALGLVEMYGFSTAVVAADAAAKAANVKIVALDNSKPANGDEAIVPLVMIVKMEGSVSSVKAGVEAAKAIAEERDLYITSSVIARPGQGTEKLAARCCIHKLETKKAGKVTGQKAVDAKQTDTIPIEKEIERPDEKKSKSKKSNKEI